MLSPPSYKHKYPRKTADIFSKLNSCAGKRDCQRGETVGKSKRHAKKNPEIKQLHRRERLSAWGDRREEQEIYQVDTDVETKASLALILSQRLTAVFVNISLRFPGFCHFLYRILLSCHSQVAQCYGGNSMQPCHL
jgi:hypothetical protein